MIFIFSNTHWLGTIWSGFGPTSRLHRADTGVVQNTERDSFEQNVSWKDIEPVEVIEAVTKIAVR